MMKKVFLFFFFSLAAGFLFWQKEELSNNARYLFQERCDSSILYRLGRVDPGYQKTREEFLAQVNQAAEIWNQAEGREILTSDQGAELPVNLIYTSRQSALDKIGTLESDLETGKTSLEAMINEYETLAADFESRLEKFNQEVSFWNERGGAPPEEYGRLTQQQEELASEAERLNAMAKELNLSVKNYNLQVGEFNQNVKTYNQAIELRPEAGYYDGLVPKIDIYLTTSEAELVHTLAHEFGHALGLDHFQDPQAIMYPFSSEEMTPSAEEIQALKRLCSEKRIAIFLRELRRQIEEKFAKI